MKVLLVRPPAPNKLSFTGILDNEPLELEYLHTGLKKAGYDDYIFDYICENKPFKTILENYEPDIVAITGYLTQENVIKNLFADIKKFNGNITTIVGGVHAQLNYERFFNSNIDFISRSECVDAFVDLIKLIDDTKNNRDSKIDVQKINGLCHKDVLGNWICNQAEARRGPGRGQPAGHLPGPRRCRAQGRHRGRLPH